MVDIEGLAAAYQRVVAPNGRIVPARVDMAPQPGMTPPPARRVMRPPMAPAPVAAPDPIDYPLDKPALDPAYLASLEAAYRSRMGR